MTGTGLRDCFGIDGGLGVISPCNDEMPSHGRKTTECTGITVGFEVEGGLILVSQVPVLQE